MPRRPSEVVVFMGGDSSSHDLSTATGYWVCQYIPRGRYAVRPVMVDADGRWRVPLGTLPQRGPVKRMLDSLFQALSPLSPATGLQRLLQRPIAAFLTTLRGRGGDDGTLHAVGATVGVPVVGSPGPVCQLTSDKHVCAMSLGGVASLPFCQHWRADAPNEVIAEEARHQFVPPLFVKPVCQEGSTGVAEVRTVDELLPAVAQAKQAGDILVQQRAPGTEMTVTLVEDEQGRVQALPPVAVVPQRASFFDHLAKRRAGRVQLRVAGAADHPLLEETVALARDVYDELGCRGFASLDFVVGNDGIELLEVNTIPTVTPTTPVAHQLRAAGMEPGVLLDGWLRRTIR